MRWQAFARFLVALIGISCAVVVYVMLRPRPQATGITAPPTAMIDSSVTATSTKGEVKRVDVETGRVLYVLRFDQSRLLADDRSIFDGVNLTFERNEVTYTVVAAKAEAAGKAGPTGEQPSTMNFSGKVRMTGTNGFLVETENATFLDAEQRISFPGAVTFKRERLEGTGVGGDLFMDRAVFWMYDQSRFKISPEGNGAPAVATGKRIGLAETDSYLKIEEGARMTREDQEFTADNMVLRFTAGTQTLNRIEQEGKAVVRQTGKGDKPDMRADRIYLDFAETGLLSHVSMGDAAVLTMREGTAITRVSGTDIEFFVGADGIALTKLTTTAPTEVQLPRNGDAPARTIQSATLLTEGTDPKGLDRALFSGGVQYREILPAGRGQAASSRIATADSLVLGLGGSLDEVTLATFRQRFCFVGPVSSGSTTTLCAANRPASAPGLTEDTVTAMADEGIYDNKRETLNLRPFVPTGLTRVVTSEIDVKAQKIDLDLKQEAFVATGKVESTRNPKPASSTKSAKATGLFENSKPISGLTDLLKFSSTTGNATYTGSVTLIQGASYLKAAEVQLDEEKQDMSATGNVRSQFFIEQTPGERDANKPTSTELWSDRMTYKESDRSAVYSGSAEMKSGDGQGIVADRITLYLLPDSRALQRLEAAASAKGEVRAKLPDGRQAVGSTLTYNAEKDHYVVKGPLAMLVSRPTNAASDMCEVLTGTSLEGQRSKQSEWSADNAGGSVGTAKPRKCAEVIK